MLTDNRNRLVIVGLDGATFDVIRPLAAQGRLPHLARLLDEGAWTTLHSTIPPISPTAWTTFLTGKNPGQHGVFDFRRLDADYGWQTHARQPHGHKTLWRLLSEAGRRVIVVDVPFTYPPEAVNGLLITGYPTPRTPGTIFTHPPDLPRRLRQEGFELTLGWPKTRIDLHADFFRAWERVMTRRERLLTHLFQHKEWDLFMVVFGITDTLSHTLWHFLAPHHPAYRDREADAYREALFQGYEQADRVLGRLWSMMDQQTHLLVVSDHGFGTVRPRQWLMRFLAEHGWLRFANEQGPGGLMRRARRTALKLYTEVGWLRRLIRELRPNAKGALRSALARGGLLAESRNVDYAASPTIPSDMGTHIYLNRRGRFSSGQLDDAAADRLANQISQALLAARDPVDDRPIVKAVHRREAVYAGPAVDRAPDLMVEYANRYAASDQAQAPNPGLEGGHVPQGILLGWGAGMRSGHIAQTHLRHLAPTALHLMGEAIPPDMDGRVIEALLDPAWQAERPIRFADRPATINTQASAGYTADQLSDVEAQLRALGYIE